MSNNSEIKELEQIECMHRLNLELLEQLNVSCQWLLNKNIILPNQETIISLLSKSKTLLQEIYSMNIIRRNFTARKSDEDFTEPVMVKFINEGVGLRC